MAEKTEKELKKANKINFEFAKNVGKMIEDGYEKAFLTKNKVNITLVAPDKSEFKVEGKNCVVKEREKNPFSRKYNKRIECKTALTNEVTPEQIQSAEEILSKNIRKSKPKNVPSNEPSEAE